MGMRTAQYFAMEHVRIAHVRAVFCPARNLIDPVMTNRTSAYHLEFSCRGCTHEQTLPLSLCKALCVARSTTGGPLGDLLVERRQVEVIAPNSDLARVVQLKNSSDRNRGRFAVF